MVKVPLIKKQNNCYLELPPELTGFDALEIFKLKDGFYLISAPLGVNTLKQELTASAEPRKSTVSGAGSGHLTEAEQFVLKRLLSIRFEKRTPEEVTKLLSKSESDVLREMENKGLVNVFKGSKYRNGVYNVKDSTYSLLHSSTSVIPASQPSVPLIPQVPVVVSSASSAPDPLVILRTRGFLITNNTIDARTISDRLNQEMKKGTVVGIKGFDGKFYITTRDYFEKGRTEISKVLTDDMRVADIAAGTKLEVDGCTAILHIMSENGDVIEKRKGIFTPV